MRRSRSCTGSASRRRRRGVNSNRRPIVRSGPGATAKRSEGASCPSIRNSRVATLSPRTIRVPRVSNGNRIFASSVIARSLFGRRTPSVSFGGTCRNPPEIRHLGGKTSCGYSSSGLNVIRSPGRMARTGRSGGTAAKSRRPRRTTRNRGRKRRSVRMQDEVCAERRGWRRYLQEDYLFSNDSCWQGLSAV